MFHLIFIIIISNCKKAKKIKKTKTKTDTIKWENLRIFDFKSRNVNKKCLMVKKSPRKMKIYSNPKDHRNTLIPQKK